MIIISNPNLLLRLGMVLLAASTLATATGPQRFRITPVQPAVQLNGTLQLSAERGFVRGVGQRGGEKVLSGNITWNSQDMNIATVSASGLVSGVNLGQVTITADLNDAFHTLLSTQLTVSPTPVLVSITVTPASQTVPTGSTLQFIATGNYSDTSTQDLTTIVTWSSSNTGAATISNAGGSQGLASAAGNGGTTISATLSAISGNTDLTVVNAMTVSPKNSVLTFAQTQQFASNVSAVNWFVDNIANGSSSVGTITTGGLYAPPNSTGPHTVKAVSVANPAANASALVFISDLPGGIWTYHNDNARTGQNLSETVLTPSNVNSTQFGKLFSFNVDGYIYGQPLYAQGLSIPGQGTHNVVFVATQTDSVYAFDAEGAGAPNTPLWHRSFVDPQPCPDTNNCISPVPFGDLGTTDILPVVGITGTPVIDTASNTLYVVVKTKETATGRNCNLSPSPCYAQRLHALDLATGVEKFGGPVLIQVSVPGTSGGSANGMIPFDAKIHNQRCALALVNGVVYIAWASHGDNGPYHGWVIGYDAGTLQLSAAFNDSPFGLSGQAWAGIWQAGGAPAADANNNLYFETGNGVFDANSASPPNTEYGDSFVKLSTPVLGVLTYFTPFNQANLQAADADLGSGGVLLLPDTLGSMAHPHLALGGGKEGVIYLLDRDNMGGFHANDDSQIVQSLRPAQVGGIFSTPALWQNFVYFLSSGDRLKQFQITNGQFSMTTPIHTAGGGTIGFPGSTPSISANGNSNGIVWALQNNLYGPPAQAQPGQSVLHAYNATNVALTELYNSNQAAAGRDNPGFAVKFTVPTVANGRVYVGTESQLTVFGLLP